ncbi:MAG: gluconate 2-dehydrogenase subunit 3 family protein [Candidatus Binataceae bacterium]
MSSEIARVDTRPIYVRTGKPIGPLAQPGYYPKFSTLRQQKFWDAKTREVVLDRVNNVPEIRFFSPQEIRLLGAVCDRILPQDDRDDSHKIPIVPQIDRRLFENSHNGYRYEDMPPDREAFKLGLAAIEKIAQHLYRCGFIEIGPLEQDEILRSLHDGNPSAAHDIWIQMPVERFWMLLVSDCAEAYYSHPWAWDEIGFGGPAYPRAYMRLERGEAEPWESEEKRYQWKAPKASVSGIFEPVAGKAEHRSSSGQRGTH